MSAFVGAGNTPAPLNEAAIAGAGDSRYLKRTREIRTITANASITSADLGKLILLNSATAITVTITAAATLGAGFWCQFKNINTGLVTIDPNSTESIDGNLIYTVCLQEEVEMYCDGTAFYTDSSKGKLVVLGSVLNPNAAQVDFNFGSGWPTDLENFEVKFTDVSPASDDVYFGMRIKTGALVVQTSGYRWSATGQGPGGNTPCGSTMTGTVSDRMALSRVESGQGIGNSTGEVFNGTVEINAPGGINIKQMRYLCSYNRSDGVVQTIIGSGYYGSNSVWTGIRFLMSTGNILNGLIVLSARRK